MTDVQKNTGLHVRKLQLCRNEVIDRYMYMHCIMQKFNKNAQVYIYYLAGLNRVDPFRGQAGWIFCVKFYTFTFIFIM